MQFKSLEVIGQNDDKESICEQSEYQYRSSEIFEQCIGEEKRQRTQKLQKMIYPTDPFAAIPALPSKREITY